MDCRYVVIAAVLLICGANGNTLLAQAPCPWPGPPQLLTDRPSLPDSTLLTAGAGTIKVCYSRPQARGRVIFGELVPFGRMWRTGANEPTMLHLPVPATVAGTDLAPGTYIVMTIPSPESWTIVFNTTTVSEPMEMFAALSEVARVEVPVAETPDHVEVFTIRVDAQSETPALIMEWENTMVRVPIDHDTLSAPDPALVRPYPEAECGSCAEWNRPHRPVHLFGNTYYVGTSGLAAVLIASTEGHVLIDAGLPDSAPHILSNIRTLGFDPADIRIVLNSHAHFDHAGGIAAIQDVTGARVLASASSARLLTTGRPGRDDPQHNVLPAMPPVPNVHVVRDQEVVRLGALALTMHSTPGHTPGGTSWSWRSCEGRRCLSFVYADSQTPVSDDEFSYSSGTRYPGAVADFKRGHEVLEALPCDVLITPHPGASRFQERVQTAPDGLVDGEACRSYVATARQQLADRLARERQ